MHRCGLVRSRFRNLFQSFLFLGYLNVAGVNYGTGLRLRRTFFCDGIFIRDDLL